MTGVVQERLGQSEQWALVERFSTLYIFDSFLAHILMIECEMIIAFWIYLDMLHTYNHYFGFI